jgi:ribosomal protein L7/L12
MKKLFRTMFLLTAMTAVVFTSCKTEETVETEKVAPTVLLNDGVAGASYSSQVDSIMLDIEASADTDVKIKSIKITRAITGAATNTIVSKTYDAKDVLLTHYDVIKGQIAINDGDKITYLVTVTDSKDKVTTANFVASINSIATSDQILLGAPSNTTNQYRFFGVANNFARYKAGSTGTELAKDNSSKVDFIYFYNSAGSVGNAIYSPDYNFTAGTGWATETSTWTAKNKTIYLTTELNQSSFDALNASNFFTELETLTWTSGVDRIPNLINGQVIAYKKADGKRGFILIAATALNATTGSLTCKLKAEL